jgi:hypothetical protein
VGLHFKAGDDISMSDAGEAEAAARDVLGQLPGDWDVRFFWVSVQETYGVRLKNRDRRTIQLFAARDARSLGLRSAVRLALGVALTRLEE